MGGRNERFVERDAAVVTTAFGTREEYLLMLAASATRDADDRRDVRRNLEQRIAPVRMTLPYRRGSGDEPTTQQAIDLLASLG